MGSVHVRKRVGAVLGAMAIVVTAAGCDLAGLVLVSGEFPAVTPRPVLSSADIADDGSLVVFATNRPYDALDTNGRSDVILSDRDTGDIYRVSRTATGGPPNGTSDDPAISGNGRFVVWASTATDLVPGDTNASADIFRFDLQLGTIERVSVSWTGAEADGASRRPRISDSGRYVVFQSSATNLVPGDTNGWDDVFVRDLIADTTTRLSVDGGGHQMSAASVNPDISGNGAWVVFESLADFDIADTNAYVDVFRKSVLGPIQRLSDGPGGVQANGVSRLPVVNDDGSVVAWESNATNLSPADTDQETDVYVWTSAGVELISVTDTGVAGSDTSSDIHLDGSGNLVGFSSEADELAGSANRQAFVRDRAAGRTDLVSTSHVGEPGVQVDSVSAISGNGRSVLLRITSPNLLPGDVNETTDLAVKSYPFPKITSITPAGRLSPGTTRTVTIHGRGFAAPIEVTVDAGGGIPLRLGTPVVVDSGTITLAVTVPANLVWRLHDVTVHNLGVNTGDVGAQTTCYDCLEVR